MEFNYRPAGEPPVEGGGEFPVAPGGAAVQRVRAAAAYSAVDDDMTARDWSAATTVDLDGAWIDYGGAGLETLEDGAYSRGEEFKTVARLYGPRGMDIRPGWDRVVSDGRTWLVASIPQSPRLPFTGWQPVMSCVLTEVKGG